MFCLIGKHSNQKINDIADSLIRLFQETDLNGEIYVGYPKMEQGYICV